ncbi:CDP-alcohol phosphatidyltransferase family protein [candidate division TA06 bacterium]|nr:CDP-alcohol phosphatidyltransferase family protein [candidate division TA06 bacterium]
MKRILPSLFTLLGFLAGLFAILSLVKGDSSLNFLLASKLILIAVLFDSLDGYTARHLQTSSKFGIQLDALTDLVTCGIAPSLLIFQITRETFPDWGFLTAVLLPLLGTIRLAQSLAKQRNQGERIFRGLPLPVVGTAISLIVLFSGGMPIASPWLLFSVNIMALLMITNLRYPKLIYRKGIGAPVYFVLLSLLFLTDQPLQVLSGLLLSLGGFYILMGFPLTYRFYRRNKKMELEILTTPEKPH